jgi:small conductance mechanosensitive channel
MIPVTELLSEIWLFIQQPINIIAIIIFIVATAIAWNKFNERIQEKLRLLKDKDETLSLFLAKFVRYTAILIGILIALPLIGVDTSSIVTILTGTGLAIAFALRDTLSNVAAGILMMLRRPFNVKDYITVAGQSGTVESIGPLRTELRTAENFQLVIPNSDAWNGTVVNHSHNPARRGDEKIRLDLHADARKAINIINNILKEHSMVENRLEHLAFQESMADGVVTINIRFWVKRSDFITCRSDILLIIKDQLLDAKCTFAPPLLKLAP